MPNQAVRLEQDTNLARIDTLQLNLRNTLDALETAFQQTVQQIVAVGQVAIGRDAKAGSC